MSRNSTRISINSLNNKSPMPIDKVGSVPNDKPKDGTVLNNTSITINNGVPGSNPSDSVTGTSTNTSTGTVTGSNSNSGHQNPPPIKIQHQFKSQEKLTLLKQVIKYNPYKNKRNGWQMVKDGYLSWKNVHRPKYADPAEDYIKRKVQEILRLYIRSGKDSLKENGFNQRDSPDAQLFVELIDKILLMKKKEILDEDEYDESYANASVYDSTHMNVNDNNYEANDNDYNTSKANDNNSNSNNNNNINTNTASDKNSKKRRFYEDNDVYTHERSTSNVQDMGVSSWNSLNSLHGFGASGLGINAEATIGELQVKEFMLLLQKNNQHFATTFASEFTKSLSNTLSKTITEAVKESIQETSRNNLEIIRALKNGL